MAARVTPTPTPARAPGDSEEPYPEGGTSDEEIAADVDDELGVEATDDRPVDEVGGADQVTTLASGSLMNCHVTELPITDGTKKK
jgi:hypothetical protein